MESHLPLVALIFIANHIMYDFHFHASFINFFCVSKIIKHFVSVWHVHWKKLKSLLEIQFNSIYLNSYERLLRHTYDVLRFSVLLLLFCWDFFKKAKQEQARKDNKKGNKKVIKEKDQRKFADNCRMHDECMVKWMSVEVRWSEAVEVQE